MSMRKAVPAALLLLALLALGGRLAFASSSAERDSSDKAVKGFSAEVQVSP